MEARIDGESVTKSRSSVLAGRSVSPSRNIASRWGSRAVVATLCALLFLLATQTNTSAQDRKHFAVGVNVGWYHSFTRESGQATGTTSGEPSPLRDQPAIAIDLFRRAFVDTAQVYRVGMRFAYLSAQQAVRAPLDFPAYQALRPRRVYAMLALWGIVQAKLQDVRSAQILLELSGGVAAVHSRLKPSGLNQCDAVLCPPN